MNWTGHREDGKHKRTTSWFSISWILISHPLGGTSENSLSPNPLSHSCAGRGEEDIEAAEGSWNLIPKPSSPIPHSLIAQGFSDWHRGGVARGDDRHQDGGDESDEQEDADLAPWHDEAVELGADLV